MAIAALRDQLVTTSTALDNSEIKIPLQVLGNQFVAEADVGGSRPLRLLLDTGASSTVINNQTAEFLLADIPQFFSFSGSTTRINTANGVAQSRIFRLERLRIQPLSMTNMRILDAPMGSGDYFDGLLGMDFLGQYTFKIDRKNALLIIEGSP